MSNKYICKNNPAHTFTEPTADFWCPLCEKNTGMLELVDESTPPIEDDGKIDALEEEIELLKKEISGLNESLKNDESKAEETLIQQNPKVESENDKNFNHSNKVDFSSTSPKSKNILIYSSVIFVLIITGIGVYKKFNGSNHSQDSTESINPMNNENYSPVPEASAENTSENSSDISQKYVNFVNNSASKIYVSYSYLLDGSWTTIGWVMIDSSVEIELPNNFNDDKIYWFAYSSGGIPEWQGSDKYFMVDQFSKTGFTIIDGVVKEDGGGQKVQKGFHKLQLESNTTEISITD